MAVFILVRFLYALLPLLSHGCCNDGFFSQWVGGVASSVTMVRRKKSLADKGFVRLEGQEGHELYKNERHLFG